MASVAAVIDVFLTIEACPVKHSGFFFLVRSVLFLFCFIFLCCFAPFFLPSGPKCLAGCGIEVLRRASGGFSIEVRRIRAQGLL